MDLVFIAVLFLFLIMAAIVFSCLQPYYRRRLREAAPTVYDAAFPPADAVTSQHLQQQHGASQHHETSSAHQHMDTPTFHHH